MELLLQNNKIRGATHNIMAYRIEQSERSTFLQVGCLLAKAGERPWAGPGRQRCAGKHLDDGV
jgi:hypothetical protein